MSIPLKYRWDFIRKVFVLRSMQLLLTSAVVVSVKPISHFFTNTPLGLLVYIFNVVLALIMSYAYPLFSYSKRHPWNYLLFFIFTVNLSFAVGVPCAVLEGRIIFQAAVLSNVAVAILTLYTSWAVYIRRDFSFLEPFVFASLRMLIIVFNLLQIFFPLGKLVHMILGCLASIIFCGYIVYDTCNLIERYMYDEYIIAAVDIYLDIINLFLALLSVLDDGD